MNEEILGGLKNALERGESLQKAMMTFFNAGYKKEEIEEAARAVNTNQVEINKPISPQPSAPVPQAPVQSSQQPVKQVVSNYDEKQIPVQPKIISKPAQTVSNYEEKKSKDKTLVIILIGLLVFLFGLLVSIFLFKNELINFFSNMLS